MKTIIVTTSWDDGHKSDVRLAELLKKYKIQGTFYVAPKNCEQNASDILSEEQIIELSKSFEIGAHTIQHRALTQLSDEKAESEINDSKKYLEKLTGKIVNSFCYPLGKYRRKHTKMVRKAGFTYARTVRRHSFDFKGFPFEARTSIHTYNHWLDLWKIFRFANFNLPKTIKYFQWENLAVAMFDRILVTGGVFHLWGHSWELDQHHDWKKLEKVLAYIGSRQEVRYATNGELAAARPKKLLMAVPYFPPHLGGTQLYTYNIAKRLQKDFGWDVRIVTSGKFGLRTLEENHEGLKVFRLPYWFKVSNTPINLWWPFILRKIIKNEDISIINAHAPVPFMSDVVSLVAGKVPFILTYHSGTMRKSKSIFNFLIWLYEGIPLRLLLSRADAIVCSSDFVKEDFLVKYNYKSRTITPAVDGKIFRPDESKRIDHPTILFVAGLTKSEQNKGLKVLIKAFAMLSEKIPDMKLMVVGDGDMRSEYEAHVRELGFKERIIFTGKLFGEKLTDIFQRSSLLVLPSLAPAESFGMVLIEAMATGKAVIGTLAGGIPRVIDHEKNGLLVPSDDPEALAEAISRLLADPDLAKKFGEAGRQKALAQYDWDIQTSKYDELCGNVLENRPTIAQIVGYYPPHIGGMEMVAQEISQELARRQYPVTVYTSDIGVKNPDGNCSNLRVKYLSSIEAAHTPIMWTLPLRLLFLPKRSIMHFHVSQAGIPELVYGISKLKGIKYVAHYHLDVGPSGALGIILPIYKRYFLGPVLRAASKVIVFSEEQASAVQKMYNINKSNLVIIPNGVGENYFYREIRQQPKERLRILYVGRLSVQKKVERLIRMMAAMKAPAHLTVVGDGEERQTLESLAHDLNLSDKIEFVGKKFGEELRTHYRNADVLAISSDIEGMPLVVLEAMAAGLPVVGSNVPGIRELLERVGILVTEPYPETFAKALDGLWSEPERLKELSRKSLAKAEQYSWKTLVVRLEEVYREIQE